MSKVRLFAAVAMAVLAMSAVAASTSSADEFTAESYPVTLTGTGSEKSSFTTTAGATACTSIVYHGTVKEATTTPTVKPTFSGCVSMGFPGVVDMNSCGYLLHLNGAASTEGTVDIECTTPGDEITGTAIQTGTSKCIYHVPPQTGLGTVKFANLGAGATREIRVEAKVSNIKYTHTKGTGLGACTAGSGTNGVLEAVVNFTAKQDEGSQHVGIFLSSL